tara:strand:+ start:321 stop:497 length:177 start_codon:yes stop_codon:yes gene_type:complete
MVLAVRLALALVGDSVLEDILIPGLPCLVSHSIFRLLKRWRPANHQRKIQERSAVTQL